MEVKMKFKMINPETNETINFTQPAFLVGNGISYYEKCSTLPWSKLSLLLLPEKIQNKIRNNPNLTPEEKNTLESILDQDSKILTNVDNETLDKFIEGISFTETIALATLYQNEGKTQSPNTCIAADCLKMKAARITDNMEFSKNFRGKYMNLIDTAQKNKIPILTTNFDRNLIRVPPFCDSETHSVDTPLRFIGKKDPLLLSNAYFSDHELTTKDNVCTQFAIWHIHGLTDAKGVDFPLAKTICLRPEDYQERIKELDKIVEENDEAAKWKNNHTWVNIFMNNDLIIFGLNLDPVEQDLRRLLVQRYFYQELLKEEAKKHNDFDFRKKETVFIYREDAAKDKNNQNSELPIGKKAFFESLDIKCVPIKTCDIYGFSWFQNNDKTN